jgi:dienelactone hydrolase
VRLPDGGPDQGDDTKFGNIDKPVTEQWPYHAVAAVIRAHSLVRSFPEVDANRTAVTGISWGGYLTCIVMGLDDRLKVAAPVYGCGYLHENSVWINTIRGLPEDWRKDWIDHFDPSRYAGQAKMPVLFVNGTNDFAYPLDSYQKTYRLVKDRQLCVTVRMPHGHTQGWAPVEIGLFADQYLRKGKPLPVLGSVKTMRDGETMKVEAAFKGWAQSKAALHYTTDTTSPWQKRTWESHQITVEDGAIRGMLPAKRPLIWFLTLTDDRGELVFVFRRAQRAIGADHISGSDAIEAMGEDVAGDPLGVRGLRGGEHHGLGAQEMR